MKLKFLFIAALGFSAAATAQKKELKTLDKSIDKGEFASAKTQLTTLEGMMSMMDDKQKEEFYFLKGKAYLGAEGNTNSEELLQGLEALAKVKEYNSGDKFGEDASALVQNAVNAIIKDVQADEAANNFGKSAGKLEKLYTASPKDTSYLFYAANDYIKAQDYDNALNTLTELRDLGYEGIETQYLATDTESGEEQRFGSKEQMDIAVMAKSHKDPKTTKTDSRRPIIFEMIARIYTSQGKNQEALDVIDDAIELNPNEAELKTIRLNLYQQLGMMEEYDAAAQEMLKDNPSDPSLYVNLGVSAANAGNPDKAKEYYAKALEIDPANGVANKNMGVAILSQERELVDKMNSLGMSKADNIKYDEYKAQLLEIRKESLPYFEKAVEANPKDVELIRTMFNYYTQLENQDKADEYKAKLDALEGN